MKPILTSFALTLLFCNPLYAATNMLISIGEKIRKYPTPKAQYWYREYSNSISSLDIEKANDILAESKRWIFIILKQEGGAAAISKEDINIISWNENGRCFKYSGSNWLQKEELSPKHGEVLQVRHDLLKKIKHKYNLEIYESICGFDTCFICFGNDTLFEVFASDTVYMPSIIYYFLNGKTDELTEYMRHPSYRKDKNSMTLYEQLIFLGTFEAIKTYAFDYKNPDSRTERLEYFEGLSWPITLQDWENSLGEKWKYDLPESQIKKYKPVDPAEVEKARNLLKEMGLGK